MSCIPFLAWLLFDSTPRPFCTVVLHGVVRISALQFVAEVVPMYVIGAFEHELVFVES